ncbi:hypothetical protein [Nitrosomonas sp.]|uniref:hypothetical protein n=1 Tax=Nitrosomonas sp. TaxID=42353 RepID=UPI001DEF5200|nr:hypothetical protein [Nitrosomonas sp.]MBX3617030.1 hypothetical protein [Nitrosomonas sp.]
MHVENNPDFKSIWQLAHDWTGETPDKTDPTAISPELRIAIDRLLRAISSKEISAKWRGRRIFIDNLLISLIFEPRHCMRFYRWLMHNEFSKDYLDNLYVRRNEVITWCDKVILLDPPPCWMPKHLLDKQISTKEAKNYRSANETEDRIRCQAIASALWELDPAIHPVHLTQSTIMRRFGNGRDYSEETIKDWIKNVDPQKKRKKGAPPKIQYKIELIKDPQLED